MMQFLTGLVIQITADGISTTGGLYIRMYAIGKRYIMGCVIILIENSAGIIIPEGRNISAI